MTSPPTLGSPPLASLGVVLAMSRCLVQSKVGCRSGTCKPSTADAEGEGVQGPLVGGAEDVIVIARSFFCEVSKDHKQWPGSQA